MKYDSILEQFFTLKKGTTKLYRKISIISSTDNFISRYCSSIFETTIKIIIMKYYQQIKNIEQFSFFNFIICNRRKVTTTTLENWNLDNNYSLDGKKKLLKIHYAVAIIQQFFH